MKDFNNNDQNQTKDKTITIPSIEKRGLAYAVRACCDVGRVRRQ